MQSPFFAGNGSRTGNNSSFMASPIAPDRRASGFGDVTFGGGDMRYRGGGGGGMNASGWASPAPMGGGRSGMMQTPGGGAGSSLFGASPAPGQGFGGNASGTSALWPPPSPAVGLSAAPPSATYGSAAAQPQGAAARGTGAAAQPQQQLQQRVGPQQPAGRIWQAPTDTRDPLFAAQFHGYVRVRGLVRASLTWMFLITPLLVSLNALLNVLNGKSWYTHMLRMAMEPQLGTLIALQLAAAVGHAYLLDVPTSEGGSTAVSTPFANAALILAPSSIVSTLGFGCLAACSSALLFSWKAYELLPLATSVQPGEIGEITEDDAAQISAWWFRCFYLGGAAVGIVHGLGLRWNRKHILTFPPHQRRMIPRLRSVLPATGSTAAANVLLAFFIVASLIVFISMFVHGFTITRSYWWKDRFTTTILALGLTPSSSPGALAMPEEEKSPPTIDEGEAYATPDDDTSGSAGDEDCEEMPAGAGGATDSVAAAVANGAIAYMPVAWLVSLWLVAWGFDSSLQLLRQFYTLAVMFRVPHSRTSPAVPADGGATESEAIVRAVRGAERQQLPHLRFLALQRLATMVEHSPAHRCDIFSSEDTWREVTHICAEQTMRVTQELRQLKQQTHISYHRRADLGWAELMVAFLGSPLQSTVEVFDRMLVYFGQHDGRYEATFAQTEPLIWSLRVLGGLFYYGHSHGEDLYGRTIRELNEDPKFHRGQGGGRNLHVGRILDVLFDCHDALSDLTSSPIIAASASERRSQLAARKAASGCLAVLSSSICRIVNTYRSHLAPRDGQIAISEETVDWNHIVMQKNRYALSRFLDGTA